jgi:hypothetical protein
MARPSQKKLPSNGFVPEDRDPLVFDLSKPVVEKSYFWASLGFDSA